MDFELSDDQVALTDGVRTFCAGRFPIDVVRAAEATGGVDRGRWTEAAELGVFSLRLPEADGGVGLGTADAVLAFEELGRALVPGPLVWTHLAAGLIDGAADGTTLVTGLHRDDASRFVEHPDVVDVVLVEDGEGLWRVDRSALDLTPVAVPLDPLTPVARAAAIPQGELLVDRAGTDALLLVGAALTSALHLGISVAATELSVAFAKERVQFDRPIGQFQALKHIMADMLTRSEVARGAVYAAGVTVDDPVIGSVERAVGAARITAGEAAIENGKAAVQVHGGMGYTWEVDAHLLLKRAYALEPSFGDHDEWAERLADLVAS